MRDEGPGGQVESQAPLVIQRDAVEEALLNYHAPITVTEHEDFWASVEQIQGLLRPSTPPRTVTPAELEAASVALQETAWGPSSNTHTPEHYHYNCAICRPDLDDGYGRIVRRVVDAIGIEVRDA